MVETKEGGKEGGGGGMKSSWGVGEEGGVEAIKGW